MCSRRNRPVLQAFIFLGLVASLGYFVYLYNTITFKLDRSERQLNKYVKHQKSLSAQLQVVYEHRARLEKSFEREKGDHKKTKEDLEDSKRNFFVNITRTRHETLNRFNSLETQHRMLKAKHEQLQVEYNRLQQQHARLSAEHIAVHNQQADAFKAMKNQKENEVVGLEAQVNTLKKQVGTWKRQFSARQDEVEYYKGLHESAQQEAEKYKATVLGLYEKMKKRQSLLGTVMNTKNAAGLSDLSKIVQSKMPHGRVVSNADAVPGHRQVTMTTRVPLKQDERGAGQVHEDVDRRRNGGKEEEEEADDSDEDNENTRQKAAQVPVTLTQTITPPPVYVPPGTLPDGVRPDIFRRQQNREWETGYRSRESQNTPIVLQDRSTQESLAVSLAATAQPRQVVPRPLTTTRHQWAKQAAMGESEGDLKAGNEGEQETEEQKVQRYLSHNAGNADNSRRQQQQKQQLRQEQRQRQEQQQQQQQRQEQQQQEPQRQEQQQQQNRQQQQQQQQRQEQQQQRQGKQQEEEHSYRSNRETRYIHKSAEQQQNSQESRDQEQNPLSRLNQYKHLNKPNPNEGLSNLKDKESSRERKQEKSNVEQKRLKHEEQLRRPIPRPGGAEKRRAGEEDSENVEPQDDGNNRGKSPTSQEEENDNEEDEGDEEKDEGENTQDQRSNQNQGVPRPDRNQPAKPAENTEEKEDEEGENDRNRRPGAKLRGLRQAG